MNPARPSVTFAPVEPTDFEEVRKLAQKIWPEVYREIISEEQIDYMIERMYSPRNIAKEVTEAGCQYDWIISNGDRIGFLAYGPVSKDKECGLHKLYLLPERHGAGIGSFTLRYLIEKLRTAEVSHLTLRVNRHNVAAIRCYERNGFQITGEDCLDIGDGHIMDDYLMSHRLMA